MKLAVFTSKYPAQVATFFERDMRALIQAGVEIDVFAIAPLDPSLWRHSLGLLGPEQLPRERVHHMSVGESVGASLRMLRAGGRRFRRDLRAILSSAARHGPVPLAKTAYVLPKALAWAAQRPAYDHVLAYWGNYAGTCAYVFHRLAAPHVPFSIWLHAGTDLYRTPVFLREKLLYADNIITCCEFNVGYMTNAFADIAPRFASKVHVCHHGLDIPAFPYSADGAGRRANRILAVGRLAKHKGFDYLVRAAQRLAERGLDVVVEFIGEGDEQRNLAALAQRLGIGERVTFRGWLPFPQVRTAMSEATLLVHPSDGLGDGLPNVVREAMALGTPVVASDVAGIPDALQDGCGVLVPPKDVESLANAVGALLLDPTARQQIAARARRRAEQRYDLWRNGATLARLLRDTTRSRPSFARAAGADAAATPTPDLTALRYLLTPPHAGAELDQLDWSALRAAAHRGGALIRLADAVRSTTGTDPLPARFSAAVAAACTNAQRTLEVVDQLSGQCTRRGIAHAFLRTVESYPDAHPTIELLVAHPSAAIDGVILGDMPAAPRRARLHHRLAKVTSYTVAYGNRVFIRHGRLGRLGEHARYARLLLSRARPLTLGTTSCLAPSPADHLLLLAMHQLYTRPAFRLGDVLSAVESIRNDQMNWDYLFATALSVGILPAVGCYLQYVDRLYASLMQRRLTPPAALSRFTTAAAERAAPSSHFPRLTAAARLYLQHIRATLESGRWHSAARLSLLPLMAALTAGARRAGRGGRGTAA